METKLSLMKNISIVVLIGCIAYLFWQNITLKREITDIKSDIGTGSYDYPQLSYYRGGVVDWLSELEYRIADLER